MQEDIERMNFRDKKETERILKDSLEIPHAIAMRVNPAKIQNERWQQ
jgi:hypothetical protein